jgi:hypothetical protein
MQYLRQSTEPDEKAFLGAVAAAAVYDLATRCSRALQWSMMEGQAALPKIGSVSRKKGKAG